MDVRMYACMDGLRDGWIDRWIDGWMDELFVGLTDSGVDP